MEENQEARAASSLDFVPTICFVPRGVAKDRPDRVTLTQGELAGIINGIQKCEKDDDDDDDDDDDGNEDAESEEDNMDTEENATADCDEFKFEDYDNESGELLARISDVVDPKYHLEDDDDSELEDDIIKPTDNLLLVGRIQEDGAMMEVWIFNEEEESLYTHHDFLLPNFPLCTQWMSYDVGNNEPGNMCAIGTMDPVITVWDLDVQDSLVPAFRLGSKGNRKKGKRKYGHTDAVVDLSWNRHYDHILASASVDKTMILWDLEQGMPHTIVNCFEDKVHSLDFHPDEGQFILVGTAGGKVRLFDGREADTIDSNSDTWKVNSEVEKVMWNGKNSNYFIIGTNGGDLVYADKRKPSELLWSHKGHAGEISGICFNWERDNLLATTSSDGMLKIWKFNSSDISEIHSHDFNMGRLHCLAQCPEDPFTVAFGGDKDPRCRVYNIKNFATVRREFDIPDSE